MNTTTKDKALKWHSYLDSDLVFWPSLFFNNIQLKYFIVQERKLSYRFHLHQHPFAQQLMQRLLRKGSAGLQSADTEYAPDELSLPLGVEFELNSTVDSSIKPGATIRLLKKQSAVDTGGVQVQLEVKSELTLTENSNAKFLERTRATFLDPLQPTPHPRAKYVLKEEKKAIISVDTLVRFNQDAKVRLADKTIVTISAGIDVLLQAGTEFDVLINKEVTILRRKMRPIKDFYSDFFKETYQPNHMLVESPYPVKDLDFSSGGAYAAYNWELFYHAPITIAMHLSKNQRFAEAQRWFHFVFDPTDDSDGATPERFWKVRPFQYTDAKKIEEVLVNLTTGNDVDLRNDTIHSIEAWKDAPFRPHVIARYRQQAYMYKTVMAYLDNLIAWGDSLFRQDTGEAIDEALQIYILAANILGRRPQPVPKKGTVRPKSYANLRQDLKQFGSVMRDLEQEIGFDTMPFPPDDEGDEDRLTTLQSLGKALYFCVPRNDKMLSYWDTIADRLFKIRNSLNFKGVFRQLALFEPPIDPALLARATAAGLDVGAIVNGLNQPLPLVRFQLLVQKAIEITQEVKSLGNNLLSAMEKDDGEAIAILRAKHERVVMEMVEHVRYSQLQEMIKSKEGLLESLTIAVQRYNYYERQLGKKPDEIEQAIPELEELDRESLNRMKFAMEEPVMVPREIEVDIAQDLSESGGKIISSHEEQELFRLKYAQKLQRQGSMLDMVAKHLSRIPEVGGKSQPMGCGADIQFGGRALSTEFSLNADSVRMLANQNSYAANLASKIGSYDRREQDWALQSNLAAGEISQIFKQLRAAQIREAIAELELKNHRQQMKHAEEIESFLNEKGTEKTGKKSNKALYVWMKREVKGLYSQCFQLAFDIAKKAERAFQHELGNSELSYIKFSYLAGKEGLLAGERLHLDLKRMEITYHELNQREYELTKHVSLLQIDPMAIIQLRNTGHCKVQLPESLFDMDCSGHFFRRIKTVALSIPCVTGPYASLNCTLTLLKSQIRNTPILRNKIYAREDAEDDRFSENFGSMQSIVTSSAQNDSGLFETNLHDERYLPFENSGVISEWRLQLPANPSNDEPTQFDYNTISDVVLHIRYTAREGGELLKNAAIEHVNELITEANAVGSVRLFSVRQEFPSEWAKLKSQGPNANGLFELNLSFREEHYPYWSKFFLKKIKQFDILARSSKPTLKVIVNGKTYNLPKDQNLGKNMIIGKLENVPMKSPVGKLNLMFEENDMSDLWFAVKWGN